MLFRYLIVNKDRIVFYDGTCNLCHWSVQIVLKYDKKGEYNFASIQSDYAKDRLLSLNGEGIQFDTIVYLKSDKVFFRSDAILEIFSGFGGLWKMVSVFKIIPRSIRDFFYNFVAQNRYRWFGKKDKCMMPSGDLASRFLG